MLIDTGTSRVITGDEGHKIDPWLWNAPEIGGDLLLAVNVDSRALALYRDVMRDGSPWPLIATLSHPAEAPHQTIKSVEPVNGGRGAFGCLSFTVQAGDGSSQLHRCGRESKTRRLPPETPLPSSDCQLLQKS